MCEREKEREKYFFLSPLFSFFLCDLDQEREDFLRYRTDDLPSLFPMKVYVKRGTKSEIMTKYSSHV